MYRIRSVDDAQQRLHKTVVIHDGMPVFIDKVHGPQEVSGFNLLNNGLVRFHLNPTTTLPPQLGYINYEGYAIYVTRRPVRRVRQGVCAENIAVPVGSRETIVRTKAFGRMLINEYPNVARCIERVKAGKIDSEAFSKRFAICKENRLFYESSRVGEWREDGGLTLFPQFKCLQELLDADSK